MKRIRSIAILVLTLAAGGCASTDPILAWQRKVGDYVQIAGGGDPSILRMIPARHSHHDITPARIIVGVLDHPGPGLPGLRERRDISGLLVGTVVLDSQCWYVFLVGVLKRDAGLTYSNKKALTLESIRLSVFRWRGEGLEWIDGPIDPLARELYEASVSRSPEVSGVGSLTSAGWVFPRPEDCFRVSSTDPRLLVTEQRTGARWALRWPE